MKTYTDLDLFKNYITWLVEETFGFTPKVTIEFPKVGSVAIVLDGSEMERSEMMGRDACNLKSLKLMLRVFARRNGYFSYLYIYPYHYINEESI